ncbi:MAG: tetratricopeptide repeat protein [Pyrinomonadaceae bacterium]
MLKQRLIFRAFLFVLAFGLLAFFLSSEIVAQTPANNEIVMVFPFENTTNRSGDNWVGESFSDSLSDLLNVPGLVVISGDERELAYQRVGLPLYTIPSLATSLKIARETKATMIVLGKYSVTPQQGETPPMIQVSARVIKANEGRVMGELMPDGNWATPVYDFGDSLTNLQKIQGRLAYQILYHRDKALPFSQNQFVQQATKVPPKAFEAYVKATQIDERDSKRENYLKNALKFYADANAGGVYPQAAFELGQYYLKKNDWKLAAEYFSRLQKKDPHYAEAAFYAGLSYWRQNDDSRALASLVPLTSDLPLIGIFNNTGAISVDAARDEKKPAERARLLEQAMKFLKSAADSSPDDAMVRFNYAYALFLNSKYEEAADQLRPVITNNPRDGQAYFLFAKSLEHIGNNEAAQAADDQARRYLPAYAKWQTEWQKSQTTKEVSLRLRESFNRDDYFTILRGRNEANEAAENSTQDLLAKARELYTAGRDEEALPELHRVVMVEPTNAEAYLLSGRINLRRGDPEAAIAALKTAIFWDPKLIDAHILLGRIFLERGDRGEAIKYATSAINLDPNNQEAIALQRQVTMGSK